MSDVEDVTGIAHVKAPTTEYQIGRDGECRVHDDGVGVSIEIEYSDDNARMTTIADFDEAQTERLAEAVEANTKQTEIEVQTQTVGKKRTAAAIVAAGVVGWLAASVPAAFVSTLSAAAAVGTLVFGAWLLIVGMNSGDVLGGGGR